jgi:NAD(P)-dependent dehydrogenase (short-subunit alcohol dehydrogenase family)
MAWDGRGYRVGRAGVCNGPNSVRFADAAGERVLTLAAVRFPPGTAKLPMRNNASLMSVLSRRSWLEIPVDELDRVMAVNLRGLFLCCRAVFPAMREQGRGKIVNISSSRVWEVSRRDASPQRAARRLCRGGSRVPAEKFLCSVV